MFKELEEYIKNWFNYDINPCNEKIFIDEFIKFISDDNYDNLQFNFDGDGSYFGKQITISLYNNNKRNNNFLLSFEIVYSQKTISIYTANNNGYWTPEFIRMEKGNLNYEQLQTKILKLLVHFFGIEYMITI